MHSPTRWDLQFQWSAEITFSSKERDHRGQGEWKIGKRSPHLLKTQSANKRKESQFKDQPLAAPNPKKTNKEKTIGKKSLSPILFERRGRLYKGLRLWRFFFFALNFFLVKFFSRYFLDFEWSTIIAKHFDQVKHQFVWPDTLAKRLIGEKSGHRKKDNEVFNFFWIEVAYEETTFMLNVSSQGATLNLIAWKKFFFFVFIAIWLHTDQCFVQILSIVNCKQSGLKTRGVWYRMTTRTGMDLFCFVLFWVQNLCCNDWISLTSLNWKDVSALNFDVFKKEQFSPRFFV